MAVNVWHNQNQGVENNTSVVEDDKIKKLLEKVENLEVQQEKTDKAVFDLIISSME